MYLTPIIKKVATLLQKVADFRPVHVCSLTITHQVAERDANRADDRAVKDQYGNEMNRQDRILQMLSRRQEEDIRTLNMVGLLLSTLLAG
jgi:hypothetical protein